jgi:hypothetical protein
MQCMAYICEYTYTFVCTVCISEHIIIYDEKGRVCTLCPVLVSSYGEIFLKSGPYYWEATIPLLVQVLRADLIP